MSVILLRCYNKHKQLFQTDSLSPYTKHWPEFGNLQSRFPSKFKGPDGSHVALAAFLDDISLRNFHFTFLSPLGYAKSITSVFSLSKLVTVLLLYFHTGPE